MVAGLVSGVRSREDDEGQEQEQDCHPVGLAGHAVILTLVPSGAEKSAEWLRKQKDELGTRLKSAEVGLASGSGWQAKKKGLLTDCFRSSARLPFPSLPSSPPPPPSDPRSRHLFVRHRPTSPLSSLWRRFGSCGSVFSFFLRRTYTFTYKPHN